MDAPPVTEGLWGWIVALAYSIFHGCYAIFRRLKDRVRISEAKRIDKLEERVERLEDHAMR